MNFVGGILLNSVNNTVTADVLYRHFAEIISLMKLSFDGGVAERKDDIDYKLVFTLAKKHKVVTTIFFSLSNALNADEKNMFLSEFAVVTNQLTMQKECMDRVFSRFESEGIDYMPFKGYFIREMYPEGVMRFSSDVDFLHRQCDRKRVDEILEESGFSFVSADANHRAYRLGVVKTEAHTSLISGYPDIMEYYENVLDRAVRKSHMLRLADEDEYVFGIVHAMKHFLTGSLGIRSISDIYFFRKKENFDSGYVYGELEKLGLSKFCKKLESLSEKWFCKGITDSPDDFEAAVLDSGTVTNTLLSSSYYVYLAPKSGNRFTSAIRRYFMPLSEMRKKYPRLEKMPFLLPFYRVKRVFDAGKNGNLKTVAEDFSASDPQNAEKVRRLFVDAGLGNYIKNGGAENVTEEIKTNDDV